MYIVSDIHGRIEELEEALTTNGIIKNGKRHTTEPVWQIGDLINAVQSSVDLDLECLAIVPEWIDNVIVGNHEMPYFDPANTFAGFYRHSEIGYVMDQMMDAGLFHPYMDWCGTLVTHAGITQSQLNFGTGTTVEEVQAKLEKEWEAKNYPHALFSDVGRIRYGPNEYGGILWCDFDEEFIPCDFPQIVGHTPGHLRMKGNSLCIDTGAKYGGVPSVLRLI